MSFPGLLRFVADFHHAMAQGFDLAADVLDGDSPRLSVRGEAPGDVLTSPSPGAFQGSAS